MEPDSSRALVVLQASSAGAVLMSCVLQVVTPRSLGKGRAVVIGYAFLALSSLSLLIYLASSSEPLRLFFSVTSFVLAVPGFVAMLVALRNRLRAG